MSNPECFVNYLCLLWKTFLEIKVTDKRFGLNWNLSTTVPPDRCSYVHLQALIYLVAWLKELKWQWLWLAWQSSHFQHHSSWVQNQGISIFCIEHWLCTHKCWVDQSREKEAVNLLVWSQWRSSVGTVWYNILFAKYLRECSLETPSPQMPEAISVRLSGVTDLTIIITKELGRGLIRGDANLTQNYSKWRNFWR